MAKWDEQRKTIDAAIDTLRERRRGLEQIVSCRSATTMVFRDMQSIAELSKAINQLIEIEHTLYDSNAW